MKNQEARLWLLGFYELAECPIDRRILFILKNHLNLVHVVEGALDETNAWIYNEVVQLIESNSPESEIRVFQERLRNLLTAR